jgi:hypothetical protein
MAALSTSRRTRLLAVLLRIRNIQVLRLDRASKPDKVFSTASHVSCTTSSAYASPTTALVARIPSRVKQRGCELAIDFHDRPYYGKTPQAKSLWVLRKAKDGTLRFYRMATAHVMLRHTRFTLAVRLVLPQEDTVTLLNDLLQ